MFEDFLGLPMHTLAVHAAVVLVPLFALASLAYALVPKIRTRVAWAAVGLAVVAPITVVVTRLSGDAFRERRGLPLDGILADHRTFGIITMWATIALGVLTLLLVWLRRSGRAMPTWASLVLTGLVVVAALTALIFVVLTGDLGSRSVWEDLWQMTS